MINNETANVYWLYTKPSIVEETGVDLRSSGEALYLHNIKRHDSGYYTCVAVDGDLAVQYSITINIYREL